MLSHSAEHPAAQAEQPESPYIVGQDLSGQWLAIDIAHRSGGFFKSRADAIHFAAFETGRRPERIPVSSVPLRMEF